MQFLLIYNYINVQIILNFCLKSRLCVLSLGFIFLIFNNMLIYFTNQTVQKVKQISQCKSFLGHLYT